MNPLQDKPRFDRDVPMFRPGPVWSPVRTLRALKFGSPRMFLVSNARPLAMAVAWRQTDGRWTLDAEGAVALSFEPTFFGEPPIWPPLTVAQGDES